MERPLAPCRGGSVRGVFSCQYYNAYASSTDFTSGIASLRRSSTPYFSVMRALGHDPQAPLRRTFTTPPSIPTSSISPPSACNAGLICSSASSIFPSWKFSLTCKWLTFFLINNLVQLFNNNIRGYIVHDSAKGNILRF